MKFTMIVNGGPMEFDGTYSGLIDGAAAKLTFETLVEAAYPHAADVNNYTVMYRNAIWPKGSAGTLLPGEAITCDGTTVVNVMDTGNA